MRHVADRMPDRREGKTSPSRYVVTIKLFLHTQVWWWHEAKFLDPPLDPRCPGRVTSSLGPSTDIRSGI
jgi:hypothetical protein